MHVSIDQKYVSHANENTAAAYTIEILRALFSRTIRQHSGGLDIYENYYHKIIIMSTVCY